MPRYKLTFFQGRGELFHYMFAIADVDYEFRALTMEEWKAAKSEIQAPFSQLPILEVDGQVLCQSHAIAVFLARELGFYSTSKFEEYAIHMMSGAVRDLLDKLIAIYFQSQDTGKIQQIVEFNQVLLPTWLNALEKLYQDSGTSYFVNDKLTLADLYFYFGAEHLIFAAKSFLGYPHDVFHLVPGLRNLYERIASNEKIADWRQKNPKTEF